MRLFADISILREIMACNCMKRTASKYDRVRAEARKLSEWEHTDYVIYDYEGRTYADRLECWQKSRPTRYRQRTHMLSMINAVTAPRVCISGGGV